jgi:hypothetical protein
MQVTIYRRVHGEWVRESSQDIGEYFPEDTEQARRVVATLITQGECVLGRGIKLVRD